MWIRIPKSKIKENLYTSGNEFVEKGSYKPYKGYYYSLGEQYFSGKTFNPNALEIIRQSPETNKVGSFGADILKYFYAASPLIQNALTSPTEIRGIKFTPTQEDINRGYANRYFVKKQNSNPIAITEVSEETYNSLTNPTYIKAVLLWKVSTGFNQSEVNTLDADYMTGIKTFLQDLNYNPESDVDYID